MYGSVLVSCLLIARAIGNPLQLLPRNPVVTTVQPGTTLSLAEAASRPLDRPVPVRPQPHADGSPTSGGVTLLTTINKWRAKYGVPGLAWSNTLVANVQKTEQDDHGYILQHELNPGSYAQVLAQGFNTALSCSAPDSPFELAYVGWLCEVPSGVLTNDNGVDQCDKAKNCLHMGYAQGQIGHWQILTNKDYRTIGCAFTNANPPQSFQGLWGCDLGF
ncbi:MAG: hypothetical protein Q9212_002309 [Teloschistes hypoglaucus]